MLRPVGFISSEIREGGVRGGRDHEMLKLTEGWRIYFLLIFESFFDVSFLFVSWKVLEGSLGALGSILESFGGHFEVIFVTFGR